ncbi:DUF5995 family protein [Haloplanus aerogenes]|uniref:Uncharacterized protein n=1 Tax=Haloplanus aerogenes TaxID=660522 RepID=A0A3M0D0P8_9EURY|nr:DUF5995 family protein [Haloplanus aerogenes]AZH24038.1 hypothetical protein DU502_01005 [Haloplanus aerogenes]RMB13189.1 hypothetical protein ATH50_2521 [Haloplanus aerogenes]
MAGYATLPRLLDGRRLRAVGLALRADPSASVPDREPDPALVALTERPFDGVADVFDRLRELETRLRAADDRRAVFLTIYTRMTASVHDAIESDRFTDTDWMRRYTVAFADYYRRAFLDFERGNLDVVPDSWIVAFGTAVEGSALVAQDAFLGINAHINYDLALTLRDVGIDPDRRRKRADHREINVVLTDLIDAQQMALADLYAPGLADVDATLGRFDEALSLFSMTEGRAQAWRIATVLTDVRWSLARRYARWLLRATATGGAVFVRSPPVDPRLLAALRRVERGQSLDDVLGRLGTALDARR